MPRSSARAALRLALTAALVLQGVALVLLVFPFAAPRNRLRFVQRWCAGVLGALGVELRVLREPAPPRMIVANHVSWLDIVAVAAVRPSCFVAKSEVRRWPLVGRLAIGAGTIFIERRRPRDILRVNALIARRLQQGDSVVVFPESTTTDGSAVLPFRGALLQPAVSAGIELQPVAISYRDGRERAARDAAYCGEMSIWASLLRVASARGLVAHVEFLAPIAAGDDRRALAADARRRVVAALTTTASAAAPRGSRSPPARFRTGWIPSARRR